MGFPVFRPPRAATALLAGLLAVLLGGVACSSSDSHSKTTTKPLPTSVPSLPDQLPKTAGALAALMTQGLVAAGSAHLTIDATGPTAVKGTGGVTMVNGRLTGLDLTTTIGSLGAVRVVEVNSVTYGRLPHPAHAGKPWAPIPARGGATEIRKVRSAAASAEQLATPANILALIAAGQATLRGAGKIGNSAALHYGVTTTVARVSHSAPIRALLTKQGARSVRLDLWVDGAGRPLTVKDTTSPSGAVSGTVHFADYNHPVAVQAPSASTIAHG
jgi:hypothetical protein